MFQTKKKFTCKKPFFFCKNFNFEAEHKKSRDVITSFFCTLFRGKIIQPFG